MSTQAINWAPYRGAAAVQRALDMVGKGYGAGWCQKFTNEIFQTGAVGDYDGDGAADAVDGWRKAQDRGKVVPADKIGKLSSIPAGVMLYWSGGSRGYGHAAVSVGGGNMVSTDLPTAGVVGKVPIGMAAQRWGLTFLGYVTVEGNGHTLVAVTEQTKAKAGDKRGTIYVVTARSGLYARKSPGGAHIKRGGHNLVRPAGFSLRIVDTKTVDGERWGHGSGGAWYAMQYLRKR